MGSEKGLDMSLKITMVAALIVAVAGSAVCAAEDAKIFAINCDHNHLMVRSDTFPVMVGKLTMEGSSKRPSFKLQVEDLETKQPVVYNLELYGSESTVTSSIESYRRLAEMARDTNQLVIVDAFRCGKYTGTNDLWVVPGSTGGLYTDKVKQKVTPKWSGRPGQGMRPGYGGD